MATNKYLFQDGSDIKKWQLGTAATEKGNAVPVLTSNTSAPPILVSASSEVAGYEAYKAFDRQSVGDPDAWGSNTIASTLNVDFGVGNGKYISRYEIGATQSSNATPKTWYLEGSNDNSTWIELSYQNGITFGSNQLQSFSITNPSIYRYYRLRVTAVNGSSYVSVSQFNLMESNQPVTQGWKTIGTVPATKAMFDTDGMTDLSIVDNTAIQALVSATPELLCWTDEEKVSPVVAANAIPVMTSNTAPSGTASSSSILNVNYEAWKTMNGSRYNAGAETYWLTNVNTGWLQYQFPVAKKIGSYAVSTINDPVGVTRAPVDFTLKGSNDGITFEVLDTKIGVTWVANERKVFTIATPKVYSYYRLDVTKNGGDTYVAVDVFELKESADPVYPSRTANLTAIPLPQLLLPVGDISIGELESVVLNKTLSGSGDLKVIVSGDSGVSWKGKASANVGDLTSVKANGYTPAEFNALTKTELASLLPTGKARFAFYLEQDKSTDTVQVNSLSINEKQYTLTPSVDSLSVLYELLQSEKPLLYVSRDDGATWKEVQADQLTKLDDLPSGSKLRVKAVLSNGQELHGLSYSWI